MLPSVSTHYIALLGKPLGFSRASAMQNAALRACKIDALYFPLECTQDDLPVLLPAFRRMPFFGFAITKPLKVKIMDYLDSVDLMSGQIGACNTVKLENGCLVGYNTDGTGFAQALAEQIDFTGKSMLVLGAGGAARAITFACAVHGIGQIQIMNRTEERAQALALDLVHGTGVQAEALPYQTAIPREIMEQVDILVNATGLGMQPYIGRSPIAADCLMPHVLVCDLAYNPLATQLLLDAKKIGCQTMNGLKMAGYQGAHQFELLTGHQAPYEQMLSQMQRRERKGG
ncbi:MAG: shikimate dehydrogenase [Butyricicoccus sp.]|nr:shikimate dehydrogenase [Butyricicoccus sp.]